MVRGQEASFVYCVLLVDGCAPSCASTARELADERRVRGAPLCVPLDALDALDAALAADGARLQRPGLSFAGPIGVAGR